MGFKRIDVSEAQSLISTASGDGLQIVDIRDEQSFNNGRIENAVHLDNNSVGPFLEKADLSKPLLVYCYHGNTLAEAAAAYFSEQGFEEELSMDGGYSDWELRFPGQIEKS